MINSELLEYIRQLSKADTKTLIGKSLKTAEEVGELAKAALPFENASGTTHRFVDRAKILEESVDVILCALSICFDQDATLEEIEEWLNLKTKKWAGLQAREEKVAGKPIPYEIHITVSVPQREREDNVTDEQFLDIFRHFCKAAGVKPIVLDLQDSEGKCVLKDVMTSSVHFGDNASAYKEMERIACFLAAPGFNVVRKKIETVPWHPAAPSSESGVSVMPKDCYFEAHVAVLCDEAQLEDVHRTAKDLNMHPSRNIFKKYPDGKVKQMLTYRAYDGTFERFKTLLDERVSYLKGVGFALDKVITEFSVYDTKMSHDASWISKG